MASVSGELAKQQFKAVAGARWAATMHSLKTVRGKLELISRILVVAFYSVFGLFFGIGAGILSYFAVINRQTELISGMIWFLFGFWQLYPILRAGYSNTFDASALLRFPVTYRTYFFLRCFYGALEPVGLVVVLAMAGITAGVSAASPALLPWCAIVIVLIVALNILTTQLVLTWVERWLAQRRTREILGIVFFLFVIGIQFIGPVARRLERSGDRSKAPIRITRESISTIVTAERLLPPGLAGYTLSRAQRHENGRAALSLATLSAYGITMVFLLDLRLRKQYRGENLGETAVKRRAEADASLRVGWNIFGLPDPLAAMVEKELRYLIRSGPMLLSFLMPLVVLLIFGGTSSKQLPQQFSSMTFPLVKCGARLNLCFGARVALVGRARPAHHSCTVDYGCNDGGSALRVGVGAFGWQHHVNLQAEETRIPDDGTAAHTTDHRAACTGSACGRGLYDRLGICRSATLWSGIRDTCIPVDGPGRNRALRVGSCKG